MPAETYEIHALRYGIHPGRTRQDNFLEPVDAHDTPMPIDYFVWVLRSASRTIVVDTGFDHIEASKRGRRVRRPRTEPRSRAMSGRVWSGGTVTRPRRNRRDVARRTRFHAF